MDDERMDLTALDPWPSPERARAVSEAIVQAHGRVARRALPLGYRSAIRLAELPSAPAEDESGDAVSHTIEQPAR